MESSTICLTVILANAAILALILYWTKWRKSFGKEKGRYYLYNDRCSFALPQEEIKSCNIQKNGLKHMIMTESMLMIILEIRDGMPNFPSNIPVKGMEIGGRNCLAAKVSPLFPDYNQYFYDCGAFVVQASITIPTDKTNQFIHSFRLKK